MKHVLSVLILLLILIPVGCQQEAQDGEPLAPMLDGMGSYTLPITTSVPEAQRFFDQGMVLAFGFNHAEAERAFREAARLDPGCAMCYWGVAYALGPNINAPMEPEAVPKAFEAMQQAQQRIANASEREQAYLYALATRYAENPPEDRSTLDHAYAEAMRTLSARYPDDPDAASFFAEALMDTTPWDYWEANGQPKPVTAEAIAALEGALALEPDHPLANHLYIHAVEAVHPEKGVAAADRLGALVPGAGHLVHMPAHIYIRVGRYHDASIANERAIEADDAYLTQCHAQGLYPLAYKPHNHHFLWASATLEGRSETSISAARHMAEHVDQQQMREPGYGTLQHYWITPLYALARFGKWEDILATPAPAEDLLYPRGVWHYVRGLALVRQNRLEDAEEERAALHHIAADTTLEVITIWDINTTASLMRIADEVLAGELAAAQGDTERAITHLKNAVAQQSALNYDEPPPFYMPVRQLLGAVLLEAGRAADAEAVYRADLEEFPENGWSLYGLVQSLREQGKGTEADAAQQRLDAAWQYADVTLAASRF